MRYTRRIGRVLIPLTDSSQGVLIPSAPDHKDDLIRGRASAPLTL